MEDGVKCGLELWRMNVLLFGVHFRWDRLVRMTMWRATIRLSVLICCLGDGRGGMFSLLYLLLSAWMDGEKRRNGVGGGSGGTIGVGVGVGDVLLEGLLYVSHVVVICTSSGLAPTLGWRAGYCVLDMDDATLGSTVVLSVTMGTLGSWSGCSSIVGGLNRVERWRSCFHVSVLNGGKRHK